MAARRHAHLVENLRFGTTAHAPGMNMLVALLATRALVIVAETGRRQRAAQINHQVRAVLRAHRADTFRAEPVVLPQRQTRPSR